jgi:predicted dehydrogenase
MVSAPRVLVVGSGFGCRIQVPALRAAGFEVVGLVGTDGPRTAQRAADNGVPRSYTDLDEAISETGATAVTVATPPHTHAALVLKAISRGCHVVCEKPFARNADEARAMLDAARQSGIIHLLGNEFRLEPQRVMIGRMIAQGLIGEPRFLTFTQFLHYVGAADVDLPHWWLDAKQGGGWLGTWGSHVVDWVRTWLGEFSSLNAVLPHISTAEGAAEDCYIVRFRLQNGAEGTLHQTGGAWGPLAAMVRVAGTKGTIWLDNGVIWLADQHGTREVPVAAEFLLPPAPPQSTDPRQAGTEWQMLSHVELAPYLMLAQIWRALIQGEELPSLVPLATFADGVAAMEVLDAIRISAAKDGELVRIRQS